MSIETLDDIISELADALEIYEAPPGPRCEWESELRERILAAVEVDRHLKALEVPR